MTMQRKYSSRVEDLVYKAVDNAKEGKAAGKQILEILDIVLRLEETSTLVTDEKGRPVYGKIAWDVNDRQM